MLGGRRRDRQAGAYIRTVLTPMAAQLGVDYDQAALVPPVTAADRVFGALRCGVSLLMPYAAADGWPESSSAGLGGSPRTSRKAAKQFASALQTEDGRDGVAFMAQGYGAAMAATWRQATERASGREGADFAESAAASDELSRMVREAWPIADHHRVIPRVEQAEAGRHFDPGSADAVTDLRAYAMRAGVVARAVALVMGSYYAEFEHEITAPVRSLHLTQSVRMLADWGHTARFWSNLLLAEPAAHIDVLRAVAAETG